MSAQPHFRVAGIPVRIEPVFWIVTAFIAFNYQDARIIGVWMIVVLVSILVHELGHALVLKAYGQPSSIVLHGFGGVTISQRRLTRARSIVVSLAGSTAALALLGVPAYLARDGDVGQRVLDAQREYVFAGGPFSWSYWILEFVFVVNVYWSIVNLLPVRPLDGGNVMTELVGAQKARLVSIVVGGGGAVWAYFYSDLGLRFAALFFAFLAFINLSEYRRTRMGTPAPSAFDVEGPAPTEGRRPTRRSGRPTGPPRKSPSRESGPSAVSDIPGGVEPAAAESFAWNLLRRGDAAGARRVLQRATGPVGPFVGPTSALAAGDGLDGLVTAYLANPSGPSNLVPATVASDTGHAVLLARQLAGQGTTGLEAAGSLQTHLHYAERFDHAAAVGEVVFSVAPTNAQVAFDTACSWARADDPDRSIEWVRRAISAGFAAPRLLDGEPDLERTRAHPGWADVRASVS